MPVKRVDFDVLAFIRSLSDKQFSISALNDAYLSSPNCQHSDPKISRQYLYRHIMKSMDQGILLCQDSKTSKAILYSLAPNVIEPIEKKVESKAQENLSQQSSTIDVCERIREKIKIHKLSLLKSIGEAEAYKEWSEEMPTSRRDIQEKYNTARDESSKLLGKVGAYESLLVSYQGCIEE